jgi:Tol biopolymer transport system component
LEYQTFSHSLQGAVACRWYFFNQPETCQPTGFQSYSHVSPNGKRYVLREFPEAGEGVAYIVTQNAQVPELIIQPTQMRDVSSMVWSSDSRWLVVAGFGETSARDIFRVEVTTGEVERLTSAEGDEWFPAWSANGQLIAFNASDDFLEPGRLMTMYADGSHQQEAVPGLRNAYHPVWSADGESLIFHSDCALDVLRTLYEETIECFDDYNLFRVRLSDGYIEQLTFYPGDDFFPAPSPDGEWIAFNMTQPESGIRQVARVRTDGSDYQILTSNTSYYEPPAWVTTPDFAWRPVFLLTAALVYLIFAWWKKP